MAPHSSSHLHLRLSLLPLLSTLLLLVSLPSISAQTYNVINNCPSALSLYLGQDSKGTLAPSANMTFTDLGPSTGFFYANASERGGVVGDKVYGARVGFYFYPKYWYYYIVRDANANLFNTGVSVTPNQTPSNGWCEPAVCEQGNCTTAYDYVPIFKDGPWQEGEGAKEPPLYQCRPEGEVGSVWFDIRFCPSGLWPAEIGSPIYHNYNRNKCVDVRGAQFNNGTAVQIYNCNGTPAQKWVLYPYTTGTKVRVANTNFCLDTGGNAGNGSPMRIWQCEDGASTQAWRFNDTNRIYTTGNRPGLCLDLPAGDETNGKVLQTWRCGGSDSLSQVWTVNY